MIRIEGDNFMSTKEKEDALFTRWKQYVQQSSDSFFVTDGIVNEDTWNQAPLKVMYFLKEVNGADTEWDERDYLLNYNSKEEYRKTHSPTINTLLRWQYGITCGKEHNWQSVEKAMQDENLQLDLLSQIALVNIKKTAGGGTVNWNNFDKYIKIPKNINFLREQLALYSPDVIICGKTAWYMSILKGWKDFDWKETQRGIRYIKENETVYIDFVHPEVRAPKNIIYYALIDTFKELNLI